MNNLYIRTDIYLLKQNNHTILQYNAYTILQYHNIMI
jgi:hypothetical protein